MRGWAPIEFQLGLELDLGGQRVVVMRPLARAVDRLAPRQLDEVK
jgi:hypothetical protein